MAIETVNAQISDTFLGFEDHGIFTAYVSLSFFNSGQTFGNYDLREKASLFLIKILRTLEINRWEDLKGQIVRIKYDYDGIYSIGHPLKEKWFNLKEDMANHA